MTQARLARRPRNQSQAQGKQPVKPCVDQDLEYIGVGHDQGQQHGSRTQRPDSPGRQAHRAAGRNEGAGHRFGRQSAPVAEESAGAHDQHRDQDAEGEEIAVARPECRHAVALDQPKQQAADNGTGDGAETAEQRGGKALERSLKTHRRVDAAVVHAHQCAAHTAKGGSQGEGGQVHPIDINAHLLGGIAILGSGAYRPAEPTEAQEGPQGEAAAQAHRRNQQIEVANAHPAKLKTGCG